MKKVIMQMNFKQLKKIKLAIGRYVSALISALFPAGCFSCGASLMDKDGLCHVCWSNLTFFSPPWCEKCGKSGEDRNLKNYCKGCIHHHRAYDKLRTGVKFDNVSKELIHQFKYYDKTILAPLLSNLATRCVADFSDVDMILPVPIHVNKLKQRKYNQASLIAVELGKTMNKPVYMSALQRVKETESQVGLTSIMRSRNVENAFKVSSKNHAMFANKIVLLVDDVISTGATAHECAKCLKSYGAASVYVICVARNDRDDSR